MANPFVVAAAQLTSRDDLQENLETCRRLARDAKARGAQLLVLPECFAFLGRTIAERHAIAELVDDRQPGPILGALLEIATSQNLWVIGGGMPEKTKDVSAEVAFNSCVVVSPDGKVTSRYHKLHLFDVDIPGKAQFKESDYTTRGAGPVIAETTLGKVGLTICYDLRFPELFRHLADAGANLIVVPAAFTAHTGAAHWHTLLRARAIETQCYVLAAGQVGQHNEKRETYGHSVIYDPWGDQLAHCPTGTGLAVAEINPARIREIREKMPCRSHRVLESL